MLSILFILIILVPTTTFAESNINNNTTNHSSLGDDNLSSLNDSENNFSKEKSSSNNNQQPLAATASTNKSETTIFIISDTQGVNTLDLAAIEILSNKKYSDINIIVRSSEQIKAMPETELYNLLDKCDIFVGEWLTNDVDAVLTSILGKHPSLSNKKLFLILELPPGSADVSLSLLRHNTINYEKIFNNYKDEILKSYFANTKRGENGINDYLNGNGSSFPILFNKAVLYKCFNDKESMKNQILMLLNFIGYNTSYTDPNFAEKRTFGLYREKWWTLEEYMEKYFDPNRKYTIGLIESNMYIDSEQLQGWQSLIDSLESKGFNVIPVFAAGGTALQLDVMLKYFTNAPIIESFLENTSQYKINVDLIVAMPAYGLGGSNFSLTTEFFDKLDVPVVRAIHSDVYTNEEWELSPSGLPVDGGSKWWHVTISEAQGLIDSTFIAGKMSIISDYTGALLTVYVPHEKNIDLLTDRIQSWVSLKYTPNIEKLISLIYYNYPPGKQNIGSSYLDTVTSIFNILYYLKDQGFYLGELPKTEKELEDLMISAGINVANWAPGELEKLANNSNVVLLPVDEYLEWFNSLDDIVKVQVIEGPVAYIGELAKYAVKIKYTSTMNVLIDDWLSGVSALLPEESKSQTKPLLEKIASSLKIYVKSGSSADYNVYLNYKKQFIALNVSGLSGWGEAPGNIMTVDKDGKKYFVIPGLKFGNIFIAPEPQRGWEAVDDEEDDQDHSGANALYHSSAVAPTHQYLAAYYYFQTYYPSAMVFIGRHGTHEWLPGKELLLSGNDFGSIVLGKTPQIYYYITDGLAEAIQAKRRGFAVMISHLTSPMAYTQLYGEYIDIANLIDKYSKSKDLNEKKNLSSQIKKIIIDNNLLGSMGISLNELNALTLDDLVSKADSLLENLQNTLYPYGLHAIGKNWTDKDISTTVAAMLSRTFEFNGSSTTFFDEIAKLLYSKSYKSLTAIEREIVQNKTYDIITSLIYWDVGEIETILSNNHTKNLSEGLLVCLYLAKSYIALIKESIALELESLLDALNGHFIPPKIGGDPIADPSVLPTGNNFYQDQSSALPTKEAYAYGKTLALLTLSDLTDDVGKLIMGIWCVETARDDGALVSVVLYLLGMEPEWSDSPSAGEGGSNVKLMPKYIPLNDLVRPSNWDKKRIDVVVITSGLFRDLFNTQSILLDNAFRVALARSYYTILNNATLINKFPKLKEALDSIMEGIGFYGIGSESLNDNFVAKHWVEDYEYYLSKGYNNLDAAEAAITRIFAPPNGDYGAGISKSVSLSWTWNDSDELAQFYLNRMGNSYTKNNWGSSDPLIFARALSNVDTIVVSRNTNQYGILDNDDFFDYWGGLSMAVEYVTGSTPNMNILSYANKDNPESVSLEVFLNRELASRYFNPEWIKGMMDEGYAGARYMSNKFISNLWGWQVTRPSSLGNWMWDTTYDIYLNDKYGLGLTDWLSTGNNAYSKISLQGTMLTAAFEGYWKVEPSRLKSLANSWANDVIKAGVACCDCSCGNIAMIDWATTFVNPDILSQLKMKLYAATRNPLFAPDEISGEKPDKTDTNYNSTVSKSKSFTNSSSNYNSDVTKGTQSMVGQNPSTSSDVGSTSNGEAAKTDSYEVAQKKNSSNESGMSLAAVICVIALVALIGVGYLRGRTNKEN
jgi:cobaltochelatase CobN